MPLNMSRRHSAAAARSHAAQTASCAVHCSLAAGSAGVGAGGAATLQLPCGHNRLRLGLRAEGQLQVPQTAAADLPVAGLPTRLPMSWCRRQLQRLGEQQVSVCTAALLSDCLAAASAAAEAPPASATATTSLWQACPGWHPPGHPLGQGCTQADCCQLLQASGIGRHQPCLCRVQALPAPTRSSSTWWQVNNWMVAMSYS